MYQRLGWRGFLVALALLLGLPEAALADHTNEVRITTENAHTLRDGEVNLGIWQIEYGLLENLDIGTHLLPWFILAPQLPHQVRTRHQPGLERSGQGRFALARPGPLRQFE